MKHLKTIVRIAGAGLLVLGAALIVFYGFTVLYVVPAAAGLILFSLGPVLVRYLPKGPGDPDPQVPVSGWRKPARARKDPAGHLVGPAETAVQDLEDPDPEKAKLKAATWLPKRGGPGWLRHLPRSRHVWRIPGFRQFKRLVAVICMVLNFIMGELSLTSPGSFLFSVFFLATSFLLADYLWKTRHKTGEITE